MFGTNVRTGGGGGDSTLVLRLALTVLTAVALAWGLAATQAGAQSGSCTATTLAVSAGGTTKTGSWEPDDCQTGRTGRNLWVDRYTFALATESRVELDLSSMLRVPLLILSNAAGAELDVALGSSGKSAAIIRARLPAGIYRLQATKSDKGRGAYQLWLSTSAAVPIAVPNDLREVHARLARALFGPGKPTFHDYNSYGALDPNRPGGCDGYEGGHSGWDAQTQSVAQAATANEPFFSLTSGEVIRAGGGKHNVIAVYDAVADLTTLYAHTRHVDVRVGQTVGVGTRLGIQGNRGLSTNPTVREHVHVEVQRERSDSLGCGTIDTINPFNYLYRSVVAASR